ncbi:MAG: AIR synthase [Eubacteriales bacterium]|nr:AIR synthase [Eubacteriales bacterium]
MAEIVVIGYAGLSGSREIYAREPFRSALKKRYPARFLKALEPEPQDGAGTEEAERVRALFQEAGVLREHVSEAREGGVFAALWRLLKQNGFGAAFCQQKIPLRQQTVELCEQYAVSPYRLSSAGCFVCLSEEGERLCRMAEDAGLPAAVIGSTERGPAIRRVDGEETAYLRRPEPDALCRILGEEKGGASYDE